MFTKPSDGATDEFAYLTLTCKRDLSMTRVSLASMARHASRLPKLILAHDDSISRDDLAAHFKDWPGEMECYSQIETQDFMNEAGKPFLADFCQKHIFGFKLAACLRASREGRTLYSDADVLWLGDSCVLMSTHTQGAVLGSFDIGKAVDDHVVAMFDESTAALVTDTPRICAGFAIYNRSLIDHPLVSTIVPKIIAQQEIGRLCEQTLVAALSRTEGGVIPREHVQMVNPNTAEFKLTKSDRPDFARHYPFQERPQFWIDARLA